MFLNSSLKSQPRCLFVIWFETEFGERAVFQQFLETSKSPNRAIYAGFMPGAAAKLDIFELGGTGKIEKLKNRTTLDFHFQDVFHS